MTSQIRRFHPDFAKVLLAAAVCTGLAGCGEDAPPAKDDKPKNIVDAGPPPPASIEELIAEHGIDDRVWMDEKLAPSTTEERVLTLKFFDGFLKGRADLLRPHLGDLELEELAILESTGQLAQLAADIEGIEVMTGASHEGQPAWLALYEFADHIEGQMWEIHGGPGGYVLQAAPLPPGLSQALGASPFEDWYAAVAAEQLMKDASDLGVERARAIAAADDPNAGIDEGGGRSGGGVSPGR